jgi:hypothetical protein
MIGDRGDDRVRRVIGDLDARLVFALTEVLSAD